MIGKVKVIDARQTRPRVIAFTMTPEQILARTKTVTRRASSHWMRLQRGDVLRAIRKGQGLKRGEKAETLGWIRVVGVSRIRVDDVSTDDVIREGFGAMPIADFIAQLKTIARPKLKSFHQVTRIEFEYID